MNVLILTPDAVGSTLLQRLITIYMQFHEYDKPVINLHELTNGIVKYYNTNFQQEVLGKNKDAWGYHQSLEQIVKLLSNTDHYKTSRLAHYHIRNRQDTIKDQISFYQYLNENFYIISCRRHNLFEHALSWGLSKVTKKLNIYSADEKINSFFDLYSQGIDLDPNSLIQTLNAYRDYVNWCNNHFNVANYFYYEEHLPYIEKYILNLPIFTQQQKLTWKDNFDIEFDQWNKCHYLKSDLGTLALNQPEKFAQLADQSQKILINHSDAALIQSYNNVRDPAWPTIESAADYQQLPEHIKHEVEQKHGIKISTETDTVIHTKLPRPLVEFLPDAHQKFLQQHESNYQSSMSKIFKMIDNGIMINNPPIKKQTLAEKKHLIRNYKNLLHVYNQWIEQNPSMGKPLTTEILDQFAEIETARWDPARSAVALFDQQNNN